MLQKIGLSDANEGVHVIRFETFNYLSAEAMSERDQMNKSLASMQAWQHKNPNFRIINVETLIAITGSSMTSSGSRVFEGFRVWFDDGVTER